LNISEFGKNGFHFFWKSSISRVLPWRKKSRGLSSQKSFVSSPPWSPGTRANIALQLGCLKPPLDLFFVLPRFKPKGTTTAPRPKPPQRFLPTPTQTEQTANLVYTKVLTYNATNLLKDGLLPRPSIAIAYFSRRGPHTTILPRNPSSNPPSTLPSQLHLAHATRRGLGPSIGDPNTLNYSLGPPFSRHP